jgi:methionyl-tRNA formyltransferase
MLNNMSKLKVVFFGTHDFAAEILQGLLDNPSLSIELVITQPDKPVGRKQELQKSAVKILAEKHGLKVEQPVSLKNYELGTKNCELGVCAQYGLIIPQNILDTPQLGILNVHTSLLPKYRGASPVQMALVNGETESGITIMKMDAGMDTGPILLQKSVEIDLNDTYLTLSQKLAKTANFALLEAINGYVSGEIIPQPQDNEKATYTRILTREDGQIDWSKKRQEIYNQYRGLMPWPGVWSMFGDKRIKLLKIRPAELMAETGKWKQEDGRLYVGCTGGSIEILELQLEGAKAMDAKTFINGYGTKIES